MTKTEQIEDLCFHYIQPSYIYRVFASDAHEYIFDVGPNRYTRVTISEAEYRHRIGQSHEPKFLLDGDSVRVIWPK